MVSAEGESFDLRTPVPCDGPVETWMSAVEAEMRRTLAAVTKEGVFYYAQTPRSRWISESLGMVTQAGSQVGCPASWLTMCLLRCRSCDAPWATTSWCCQGQLHLCRSLHVLSRVLLPQVWWTWETEDVFRRVRQGNKHAMKEFGAKLTGQLQELTGMVSCAMLGGLIEC